MKDTQDHLCSASYQTKKESLKSVHNSLVSQPRITLNRNQIIV